MKLSIKQNLLISLCVYFSVAISNSAYAEHVKIADTPLVNSGTSDVLPNIMFILDNSGSMDFNYTPDWVEGAASINFKNPDYNTQYYNPAIRYEPAVNYNGVSRGSQTSWTSVKNDNYNVQNTGSSNLVGNASYYAYVPNEYCKTLDLDECAPMTSGTTTYPFPAPMRWCKTIAAAVAVTPAANACQAIRQGEFIIPRMQGNRVTTIKFTRTSGTRAVTRIRVNGLDILNDQTGTTTSTSTMAEAVKDRINQCSNAIPSGSDCTVSGYFAQREGDTVIISAPVAGLSGLIPVVTFSTGGGWSATTQAFAGPSPGAPILTNIVSGDDTYTAPGKLEKAPGRTDCKGSVCTYSEEMTNYANWWTYYRTRMQAMKTAASIAFKGINNRYRVGFITISKQENNYLNINVFEDGENNQKHNWYKKLFATKPEGGTPLRSALSLVGRIYAGKKPFAGIQDPVEYSCQQNFSLLTTDGYWNTDTASTVKDINGGAIGNLDANAVPPLYEGKIASSGSLADVAKYYYDTDIRNKVAFENCSNGTAGSDVCGSENDHPTQNMVTLTLGLGIDGTLLYSDDYKNQKAGTYVDLKNGDEIWPVPVADSPSAIDDLWHAAVNSGGTYYSARNPKSLRDSLIKGLSEIKSVYGAGSAAAASSLAPTSGDNFQFVASYVSVKWTGNLEARTVDVDTLETSRKAEWCAESVQPESCTLPAVLKELASGKFYCETASSDETSCSELGGKLGLGDKADACYQEVKPDCEGTMSSLVSDTGENSRKIYVNNGGGLVNLSADALSPASKTAFEKGYDALSQYADFTTDQKENKNKVANLVNYIRGQKQFENRSSNPTPANKLFRPRDTVLGDITQSKPAYLKKSPLNYVDPGYLNFRDSVGATRQAAVFVGANDGMLHAFNANSGKEMWAFIPTPVIKNLPKLADRDYAIQHTNFVNGNPYLADICVASCETSGAQWKTILVGGLNGGGRGYYALDVTDTTNPILLWEFTSENDANLGYSFGEPIVTKLSTGSNTGRWVVLLTSGYNNGTLDNNGVTANVPAGNGGGYLYIRDAYSGAEIKTIATGAGSSTSPSGLSKIAAFASDAFKNNFATQVYGGDLEGGLWRFDINNNNVVKVATLGDPNGARQPITTAPQLGLINKKRVIFVGTGKYLEPEDLISKQVQSVYAIKDDDVSSEMTGLRGGLELRELDLAGDFRTVESTNEDLFSAGIGWMLDFPAGERVNIDPLLLNGVLLMPTTVPNSTSCLGGGYGWFNYFNYKTGGSPNLAGGVVSEKLNTPAVGFNILYDDKRKPVVSVVESNDPTPHHLKNKDVAAKSDNNRETVYEKYDDGTYGRRSIWRELIR